MGSLCRASGELGPGPQRGEADAGHQKEGDRPRSQGRKGRPGGKEAMAARAKKRAEEHQETFTRNRNRPL